MLDTNLVGRPHLNLKTCVPKFTILGSVLDFHVFSPQMMLVTICQEENRNGTFLEYM